MNRQQRRAFQRLCQKEGHVVKDGIETCTRCGGRLPQRLPKEETKA